MSITSCSFLSANNEKNTTVNHMKARKWKPIVLLSEINIEELLTKVRGDNFHILYLCMYFDDFHIGRYECEYLWHPVESKPIAIALEYWEQSCLR